MKTAFKKHSNAKKPSVTNRLVSAILAAALAFGMFAAMPLGVHADGGIVLEYDVSPMDATYPLGMPASPLRAVFRYANPQPPSVYVYKNTEMTLQWYMSDSNSTADRSHGLGVLMPPFFVPYDFDYYTSEYDKPATDKIGVRYYFAVLSYVEYGPGTYPGMDPGIPKEAVTSPARVEVVPPEQSIDVYKVDENGEPLAGAVLLLSPDPAYAPQHPSVVPHEATTDANGKATFTAWEGYYILTEKQAPAGYTGSDAKHYLHFTPGVAYIVTPSNSPTHGSTERKYDRITFTNRKSTNQPGRSPGPSASPSPSPSGSPSGSPLPSPSGSPSGSPLPSPSPSAPSPGLPDPSASPSIPPFPPASPSPEPAPGGAPSPMPPVSPSPPPPGGAVFSVKKVDADGKPLSGAIIALDPDPAHTQGASVKPCTERTVDGYAAFSVPDGYYILSEKLAPPGYNATDEKYYIRVTPGGVLAIDPATKAESKYGMVTFVNKLIPSLNKEDHFAYMQGYPEGDFRPERNMTRAEAVVMFSRLLTKSMDASKNYRNNYYPDVPRSEWYANQVCHMQSLGVLADYSRDGRFRPDEPVTRAEFATLAAHFDNLEPADKNNFSDVPASHWAVKYINSAAAKGWVTGYPDGTFKPEANITRAEVVTLVNRMLERAADSAYLAANAGALPRSYFDLTKAHWAYFMIMEASTGHDFIKDAAGEHWTAAYK